MKTSKSPAQKGRSAIADAVRRRGQSPYNLWIIRPPLQQQDIIVNSDPKMELVYLLEGDPRLEEIDYGPLRNAPDEERKPMRLTASKEPEHFADIVRSGVKGRVFWGGAQPPPPKMLAPSDLYLSIPDLDANVMRIDNWRRIAPTIRRVSAHPTAALERQVIKLLGAGTKMSLADIQSALIGHSPALVLGVVGILLRRRHLEGDVDQRLWSLHTRVWARRPA
jgi:hypothetical protein